MLRSLNNEILVTVAEIKKKDDDYQGRSPANSTLYQFYALGRNSKMRVRQKLQRQLTETSRFLKV